MHILIPVSSYILYRDKPSFLWVWDKCRARFYTLLVVAGHNHAHSALVVARVTAIQALRCATGTGTIRVRAIARMRTFTA